MAPIALLALIGGMFTARAAAHGFVQQIKVGKTYYPGYDSTKFPYMNPPPVVAGWTDSDLDIGFVAPDAFQSPDIICHKSATNGKTHIPVTAGQQVRVLLDAMACKSPWPCHNLHGKPSLPYHTIPTKANNADHHVQANCNDACGIVDKTKLTFVKVDAVGPIKPGNPGTWATQNLIAANNTWTYTVPKSISPGNYVVRHELIALHSAGDVDGAQSYPQCINFAVSGGGMAKPVGTLGEKLYTENDPGILFNLYKQNDAYTVPGPKLFVG